MSAVGTAFERSADPRRASWANGPRRALRGLLAALDRLVPPRDAGPDAELPPEWFKYPPI